jgi:dihydrofolate reductase
MSGVRHPLSAACFTPELAREILFELVAKLRSQYRVLRRQDVVAVIYYVAASLDGYIAPPDRGLSWLAPFESAEEDYGYTDFYRSIDAVLVGSQTFKQAAQFPQWPYPEKPCWVFSRQLLHPSLPHVFVTDQSPREVVAELDRQGCQRAWLVGGGQLAGSFRVHGLISEYIVTVIPVVLGAGAPLFGSPAPAERLHLVASKVYPTGLVQLYYLRDPSAVP